MKNKKLKSQHARRFDFTVRTIRDEEISVVEHPAFERHYDEEGHLLKEVIYDHRGILAEKYEFVYDKGIQTEQLIYLDEEEVAEHQYFRYDEAGRLVNIHTEYAEGYSDDTVYTYDDAGRLRSKISIDDGEEGEKYLYEYGDKLKKTIYINDFGTTEYEMTEAFDDKGRLLKEERYYPEDEYKTIEERQYNEEGHLVRQRKTNTMNGHTSDEHFYYSPEGMMLKSEKTENGIVSTTVYRYDEEGRETGQEERLQDGKINHTVERHYDENGFLLTSEVEIHNHGESMDSHYLIKYSNKFYE